MIGAKCTTTQSVDCDRYLELISEKIFFVSLIYVIFPIQARMHHPSRLEDECICVYRDEYVVISVVICLRRLVKTIAIRL